MSKNLTNRIKIVLFKSPVKLASEKFGLHRSERKAMLIVTRKLEEIISIGDGIAVQVLRMKPNGMVEIGIRAPKEMPIDPHRRSAASSQEAIPSSSKQISTKAYSIDWDCP